MIGLENPIHILFLLVILLLLFGAKRLPDMGRSLGSGIRGFKEAISGEAPQPQVAELVPTELGRAPEPQAAELGPTEPRPISAELSHDAPSVELAQQSAGAQLGHSTAELSAAGVGGEPAR